MQKPESIIGVCDTGRPSRFVEGSAELEMILLNGVNGEVFVDNS